MPAFGAIDLGQTGSAAFELTKPSGDAESIALPGGLEIVIPAAARYVVVKNVFGASFDAVYETAREAANEGLDFYIRSSGPALSLAHKSSPELVVWADQTGQTARIVGRAQTTTRVQLNGAALGSSGVPVPPTPTPSPSLVWQPSLRYYRASEAATDLYDSFRNLYLALEALLSSEIPVRPGERESDWLKRALQNLHPAIHLVDYAPTPSVDPPAEVFRELYVDMRTAIFHAKDGRQRWLPQQWSSRSHIVEARVRYARLFRALAEQYLGPSYRDGGLTKSFWEDTNRDIALKWKVFVSDDPTQIEDEPEGDYGLSPAGRSVISMSSVLDAEMSGDWAVAVRGVALASGVGNVQRFGTSLDGTPMIVDSLRAPLSVDSVRELQVVVIIEGRNYGQPRTDFET